MAFFYTGRRAAGASCIYHSQGGRARAFNWLADALPEDCGNLRAFLQKPYSRLAAWHAGLRFPFSIS
jgi:hypothetical protein